MRIFLVMVLLGLLGVACGPKQADDVDTGESGGTSSGTTGAACTPGELMTGPDGCQLCECNAEGVLMCPGARCDPTTDPVTTGGTSAGNTAGTSTGDASTGDASTGSGGSSGSTGDATTGGPLLPFCSGEEETDLFTITNAAVIGDTLVVDVSYGGGCETHDFLLCFDGYVIDEGWRVLRLDHDAHGDLCEAIVEEQRSFDLTVLHDMNSPVEFLVDGWPELFVYEF